MKKIKKFIISGFYFLRQIYKDRNVILTLSRRDFERQYIQNFFGLIWAILEPFALVMVLYLVFGVRFGDKTINGATYVEYVLVGYIVFGLFTSIQNLTSIIKTHSFLLRKTDFKVASLPIIGMLSNLMMHGILVLVAIVILLFNNNYPSFYWFQLIYYMFSLSMFLIGATWFTSSVFLFFPDIKNMLNILVRVMFFATPIFWTFDQFSDKVSTVLKLNPLYYIATGYRDSLLYNKGFWEHPTLTIYFWSLTLIIMLIGLIVFRKLRPHFADVV
ncbi:MAG: ABC transporter permease [Bacteroidales bacterium]|nr:ABC transporter permease [Bacteroidales bacterium]